MLKTTEHIPCTCVSVSEHIRQLLSSEFYFTREIFPIVFLPSQKTGFSVKQKMIPDPTLSFLFIHKKSNHLHRHVMVSTITIVVSVVNQPFHFFSDLN